MAGLGPMLSLVLVTPLPIPDNVTVCEPVPPLSCMTNVPLFPPDCVGLNINVTLQDPPGAAPFVHWLVLIANGPVTVNWLAMSTTEPVLVNVIVLPPLVEPMAVAGKVSEAGAVTVVFA